MSVNLAHVGLAIDSPLVNSSARNFRPPSWPPPPDFPIVIDANGNVVCVYGDPVWDVSVWHGRRCTLNFGDGPRKRRGASITPANADLLRQITAWWLYGHNAVQTATTLLYKFNGLRSLFVLCSEQGIVASDLVRFPAVAEKLPEWLPRAAGHNAVVTLHMLYEQREQLGFTLLDRDGLTRLEAALPSHDSRQTPYIPPRIWGYQVRRQREFLDDFLAHRQGIEACFRFCLDAYVTNFSSLREACRSGKSRYRAPFSTERRAGSTDGSAVFHGPFVETAKRFGIDAFLRRWCGTVADPIEVSGVRALSICFTMVGEVGIAYLLNFSLMRIAEAHALRVDCLEIERDDRFGTFYVLRGETTKTIKDDDARWPAAPDVKVAVDAMSCVAELRVGCTRGHPGLEVSDEEIRNPYLTQPALEPWAGNRHPNVRLASRPGFRSYEEVIKVCPKLLDPEELRIKESDLQIARLVNPDLDSNVYRVGEIWSLGWHQLRRTGAVNMQASGLVSDASLQYQLKHASRAMSLYYGQGYSKRALNREARDTFIRTMYEVLSKEVARLFTDRFVSPHGEKRKAEILKLVDHKDAIKLTALAKSGEVACRINLLGVCTFRGACKYGGVDNIVRCGGGDGQPPCADVLYDREKIQQYRELEQVIDARLLEAPEDGPRRESLEAQKRAVTRAIRVVEA